MTTTVPQNCTAAELRRRHAFGAAVRNRRKALGLTQPVVAERAGYDRQSISRIENAAYSPSLDRLWALADALQCPLSELLTAAEGQP